MKSNEVIGTSMIIVGIGMVIYNLVPLTIEQTVKGVNYIKFKSKIRKGLKEGRIVKINGEYYEIGIDVEED